MDDSKKTVQAKKVEEVQFPKTEKIVLNEDEQKQFQELVNNQTINGLLKDYSAADVDKYEVIKKELRKVITIGKYQESAVQAYLNELEDRCYFCNLEDVTVPLEITKEDTVTTTASTPKKGSIEEFKKSLDNIENNVKECGDNLPFGNNTNSRYQEDDESNCYQSEEEKAAMSSSSSYDESQDAIF